MDTYKKPVHEVCIDKTDCKNEGTRSKPTADITKDAFRTQKPVQPKENNTKK